MKWLSIYLHCVKTFKYIIFNIFISSSFVGERIAATEGDKGQTGGRAEKTHR